MAKEETNKVKLVRIENKVDQVVTGFSNHLEHHKKLYDRLFRIFLVFLAATLAAGTTVALALLL